MKNLFDELDRQKYTTVLSVIIIFSALITGLIVVIEHYAPVLLLAPFGVLILWALFNTVRFFYDYFSRH